MSRASQYQPTLHRPSHRKSVCGLPPCTPKSLRNSVTISVLPTLNVNCEVRKGLIVYVTIEEFSTLEIDNVLYYSLPLRENEGMDFAENSADDLVVSE